MWDIHGNPLTKGHCEVHPHIAQEYPCHVCQEQQRVSSIHQQASEIVDYEATLEEKMHQVRQMAALTADQYTVNLLGHIHEDVKQLQAEREFLREKLKGIYSYTSDETIRNTIKHTLEAKISVEDE